jgi:hypothetical protein
MGKIFQIVGAILTGIGAIGLLGLIFNIGINTKQLGLVTTYGVVETILITGLIFQVLYKVTEGEL